MGSNHALALAQPQERSTGDDPCTKENNKMALLSLLLIGPGAVSQPQEMRVKHSDVVFMGAKEGKIYEAYGATMVSWGGFAWKQRVKEAHDRGLRYCAGLAFRTAFAGMIDFDEAHFMDSVCRTLEGEPITVPWLWDHEHKGYPAYWFCTNAPGYRAYLRHQTEQAMVADVEGLHIDDYNGTAGTEWQGGCFCPSCMAAFREWAATHVPSERLEECGVKSLEGFDYGAFLRGQGVTTEDWKKRNLLLPLGNEYLTFQYQTASEFVSEIHQYAEKLVGHPLMLSVNSSASDPKALVIANRLTYFCGEVSHEAASRAVPWHPVFVFKIGDALERPQVCTASGQDWAYIMEHNLPGLVRTWIAQSYAYGHQLMAPHRQWAYTQEKGTHWYQSTPEDYAYLYRFVRQYAELFDDYEALSSVGLVYSNAAFRANKRAAYEVCLELARANVPFRIIMAGDEWLEDRLTAEDLEGLRAIVVTEPLMLDAAQQAVLDAVRDRLVQWPDWERLRDLVPQPITVEGGENITILPRAVPGDPARPVVVHLLNRNYDGETDRTSPQKNLQLTMSTSLLGRRIGRATLYTPQAEPLALELTVEEDAVRIIVPGLDLWGILALQ
ncbi:MAG: hypothetical protein ACUVX8_09675 [Candidatus Zipacnadales bacterium]